MQTGAAGVLTKTSMVKESHGLPETVRLKHAQSEAIKGILILLIVIGHNPFLVSENSIGQALLYQFHVWSFFLLPFCYEPSPATWRQTKKNAAVNYGLFLLFVGAFYCRGIFLHGVDGMDLTACIKSIFFPYAGHLKRSVGAHFMWFLPAYTVIMVLWTALENSRGWKRILLSSCIGIADGIMLLQLPGARFLQWHLPFKLNDGLLYVFIGKGSTRWIEWLKRKGTVGRAMAVNGCIFAGMALLYVMHRGTIEETCPLLVQCVMTVVFFAEMHLASGCLARSAFLCSLGRASLTVYLLHIFMNRFAIAFLRVSGTSFWGMKLLVSMVVVLGCMGCHYGLKTVVRRLRHWRNQTA